MLGLVDASDTRVVNRRGTSLEALQHRGAMKKLQRLRGRLSSIGCRAQSAFGMACPIVVQKALERIQLDVASPQDERLIASWLDWIATHEMAALQKCPSYDDCEE